MDEHEILEIVKERLAQISHNYESLTTSQKKHLLRIEPEISRRLTEQKQALNIMKGNKINIASITSAVSITRKTVYNNDVLKHYIEYAGKLYDAGYPTDGLSELKKQLSESKDLIDKMVRRDANIENLKSEIVELQKEVLLYKDQVNQLTEDNIDLTVQIRNYEKKQKLKSSLNVVK
ncbi:hypothetical protein WMO40_19790 [Bacillaceae bacterium CLA-AA-H227]|uniref:Uncharacterized protein n=1 Tax=Robertmurraya yapensis (ex Hitch et al 2024) TaxID=3133160 RepID=A0ACC6SFW4_9BACI